MCSNTHSIKLSEVVIPSTSLSISAEWTQFSYAFDNGMSFDMDISSFDFPLRHSCAGRNLNAEQDNMVPVWRFRIADRVGNDDTRKMMVGVRTIMTMRVQ